MGILEGKKGVILGVANKRSIAWGIAKKLNDEGARLGLNYLNEKLGDKVKALAGDLNNPVLGPCDLTKDDEVDSFFKTIEDEFGGSLDFLVHSVAFAKKEDLEGSFVDTSREGFSLAHEISAYTLVAAAQRAMPMMAEKGGSIITMTYMGSERVIPNYNVMGVAKASLEANTRYLAWDLGKKSIRVNSISAGPVNTLSARGIAGFTTMLDTYADRAPMNRNIEIDEVANTALFLVSDMSTGITGECIHVDAGYHIMGM